MTQRNPAPMANGDQRSAPPTTGTSDERAGSGVIIDLISLKDNQAADGKQTDVIEVKATVAANNGYLDTGYPVSNAWVTLTVTDDLGNIPSEVKLYLDEACSQELATGDQLHIDDQTGITNIYAACSSNTNSSYKLKVASCNFAWYMYVNGKRDEDAIGLGLNFVQSSQPPVGQLTLQATNKLPDHDLTTCTVGKQTTGIDILVQLNGAAYSSQGPFVGFLKPAGGSSSAGSVQLVSRYTDRNGQITAKVFPTQQGNLTLTLTDTITQNKGSLDFKAIVLQDPVQLSANPDPITGPVNTVVFTASFTDIDNTQNPAGVLLQWSGADAFTQEKLPQPLIVQTTSDLATRQVQSTSIVQADFVDYPNGGLNVTLSLYGTKDALTFTHEDWFDSSITGLKAPYIAIGEEQNGITYIGDGEYENLDGGYLTVYIPTAADPLYDGSSVIKLYRHTEAGTELDPATDGPPLASKTWSKPYLNNDLPIKVPLSSGLLDANGSLLLYYTLNNGKVANTSQPLEFVVDRQSLSENQPSGLLRPPSGVPSDSYYTDAYGANEPWGVHIPFNPNMLTEGDTILVKLDTTGLTTANLNEQRSMVLPLYTVTGDDAKNKEVKIEGDKAFSAQQLADIDYSWGGLYYEYTRLGSTTSSTSPSQRVTVDTVSPHSSKRFWRVRFPSSRI